MDYQEFADRFKSSGLSQRAFAIQEGMSASMVSYYVNRAKKTQPRAEFTEISISEKQDQEYILITTRRGIEIKIPV